MKQHFRERWKAVLLSKNIFSPGAALWIGSTVLCVWISACDLFKTRTPQEPTQVSANYVQPSDPDKVMQNMSNAFLDKNRSNYTASFSNESFTFEPTGTSSSKYPELSPWDKTKEGSCFDKIMSRLQVNSSVTLRFTVLTTTPFVGDSTQVETEYQLTVPHTESQIQKNFHGRAQFMFIRSQQGTWSIRHWLDFNVGSPDSSWSDLKGIAIQQW